MTTCYCACSCLRTLGFAWFSQDHPVGCLKPTFGPKGLNFLLFVETKKFIALFKNAEVGSVA
jgi:hypothetical protein